MAKILYIEDDAMVADAYKTALEAEGHAVDVAVNGEEGIQKLKADFYNLVILDVMMPEMNGVAFMETIREDPVLKDVRVVALSNLAGTHDSAFLKEKGVLDYLVKSQTKPRILVEKIEQYLS